MSKAVARFANARQHHFGAAVDQLKSSIQQLVKTNSSDTSVALALQPLPGIHLHSNLKAEFKPGGNISYLYMLGTAALFILVLASINFTNLNTARATTRTKEVGMRKVLGGVTPGFIETMGIKLISGRRIAENSKKDEQEAFILNESAARELGWNPNEAIGKSFSMPVPPINGGRKSGDMVTSRVLFRIFTTKRFTRR